MLGLNYVFFFSLIVTGICVVQVVKHVHVLLIMCLL